MRSKLIIAFSILLVACASGRPPPPPPINDGQQLQLKQDFNELANGTWIYLQNGNRISEKALDRWTTYCRLYIYNPEFGSDYVTSISAGEFKISQVKLRYQSSEYPYYGIHTRSTTIGFGFIGFDDGIGIASSGDGPPSYYLYRIEMKLDSATQPDLRNMICAQKTSTRGYFYPSLPRIAEALGEIGQIIQ